MNILTIQSTVGAFVLAALAAGTGSAAGQSPPASSLDFEFFKTRVQPIFTAKRPGHARCIVCHTAGTPLRLQSLAPGATTWDDEASRKNFEAGWTEIIGSSLKQFVEKTEKAKS